MSEPTPTTTPDAPEAQVEAPQALDAEPKTFDADYVAKLRQEAAKYRTEAKANADAAKRLAEIEEAQKTEAQKLAERLAEAEAKAAEAELRALRSDVAREGGVPPELLQGDTEEAMRANLAALLAFKGERRVVMPPAEGVQGNTGTPIGVTDWDTAIADAQKRGDVAASIYLKNKRAEEARKP